MTLLAAVLFVAVLGPAEAPWCGPTKITGYVRGADGPATFDGTSIWTSEKIAAASLDVRMGSMASVEGLGVYRIADRGALGNGVPLPWLDIAVWTPAEAYAITSIRTVCFRRPAA